jgi:flagellar protein FliL
MATNAKADTTADETEVAPKKGKGKLLLIVGGVVAALLLGGAAAYFVFGNKPQAEEVAKGGKAGAKGEAKAAEKADPHGAAKKLVYAPMDTFTVNLHDADREHFLQTTINLEVVDASTAEIIKQQMPAIRNRVLLLLSSKGVEELTTREGKEKLATEIAVEVRKSLDGAGETKGLEQVLFSHFVIQ